MKPILLHQYKGFLIRVVDNGSRSHPYEWTIDGRTPSTRKLIKRYHTEGVRRVRQTQWMRKLRPRETDPVMLQYYRKARLNSRGKRLYDPTSMPTARGRCSALDYGRDEVEHLLEPIKPYPWFNR